VRPGKGKPHSRELQRGARAGAQEAADASKKAPHHIQRNDQRLKQRNGGNAKFFRVTVEHLGSDRTYPELELLGATDPVLLPQALQGAAGFVTEPVQNVGLVECAQLGCNSPLAGKG